MLKNYLTIALRSFWKNKGYSFINIIGLSIGLACSILILLWVQDEFSYDRFHEKGDRLYQVMEDQFYSGGQTLPTRSTPGPLAEALKKDVPEVANTTRVTWNNNQLFSYAGQAFKEEGVYADSGLFEIFSFPFLHGNPATALSEPNSIVLTRKMAEKYFGSPEQAFGQILRVNNREDVQVTGVVADVPKNSSLTFAYVMPVEGYVEQNQWLLDWGNNGIRTFVLLHPEADGEAVSAKIKNFLKNYKEETTTELFLQAYTDAYLHSDFRQGKRGGGRIEYVRLFVVIAVFILLIACINFMNLSTARSGTRAKEVGVRKAIGAGRQSLVGQFMSESLLLAFASLLLSLILVELLLPSFNDLTGKQIAIDYTHPAHLLAFLGIGLLTGLLAGSYPALFLSGFEPTRVLKGDLKTGSGAVFLRQGLVVFQFSLSVFLILGTVVVFSQIRYIKSKNLGYAKENLLILGMEGNLREQFQAFRNEVAQIKGVLSFSATNQVPSWAGSNTANLEWEGKQPDESLLVTHYYTDQDFLSTMGMELKEGRDFSPGFGTDTANILINEETARRINVKNPVGSKIKWGGREGTIIGVVKDFHSNSLHIPVEPAVLLYRPEEVQAILLRLSGEELEETLAQLEQVHQRLNPAYPFDYQFLDQNFERQYRSETVIGKLANWFAFIAILISCLGLFGLAAFTAERRTKEIGIRKVLGASVGNIVGLLSKEFVRLVLIAFVITSPLAWYALRQWLQDYPYRIDLEWWMFALTGGLALLIALLTVSYQSIKAALGNPVKSLKSE
jgi:putative ABC transport system permease protein